MSIKRDSKVPGDMTAGEVNRELVRLDAELSVNTRAFIDAGRGDETYDKILDRECSTDPLSRETQRIQARRRLLLDEIERECGPGVREFPPKWRRKRTSSRP